MKAIKILISGIIFCSMLISCNNSNEKIQTENKELIENYFKLFNEHKWKELSELYVENAEFRDPSLGQKLVKQSKAEFIKRYSDLGQICPDIKDEITQIYPSGDNVIVEFLSTGTTPDRSEFELAICTIFKIENGKITRDLTYYNNFDETK